MFGSALPIIQSAAEAFRPPRRVSVAEGAGETLKIIQPGGYTGFWSHKETPYMVEPMSMLASRNHEAVVFVGPARSGKTMGLLDAWVSYAVTCDPGDMLIVQMTQDKARDYSKTRIDRAIRNSPKLAGLKSTRAHDDNTHDKLFKHGMWLKIGWPSASQLASSDYRYVALTDYDRMPDDIDGEGSAFQLGLKRTTTFLSRGMCMVESSPGKPITDPNFRPTMAHEAPPSSGILGIYNRGDRRQLYWPCPHCKEYFRAAPGLDLFASIPEDEELLRTIRGADLTALAREHSVIFCPHCGTGIEATHKQRLLEHGEWLRDGQEISKTAKKSETGMESSIASYWLGGVAAAYQSWYSLLLRYFHGLRDYASSGSELALQVTVNTDQGAPYLSRAILADRSANDPADNAEDFERYIVPEQARFLTAAVDVQGGQNARFVVQVHAHGPDQEQWLIDRYEIKTSHREGPDGEPAPLDPASYPEDWDCITDKVVTATYRTHLYNQELRMRKTIVDTGGEEGVTENAYQWWRRCAKDRLSNRVALYKGASSRTAPLIKESKVGKGAKADVPLLVCNPNLLKDAVINAARRADDGTSRLHFPQWLGAWFWDEWQAEVRQTNGTYKQIRARNEALDLAAMNRAAALLLGVRRINWDNPPAWARPLEQNSYRVDKAERREERASSQSRSIGGFKNKKGFSKSSGFKRR
ncbi:MAG: phage terminase large subunit family protein [Saccharospirillum sp.]|nr:phage terminase large subunit family protein [Saccharospirillum sp.]